MHKFNEYTRTGIAEMRPVTKEDGHFNADQLRSQGVSISDEDALAGSPKDGDMVARNPQNHADQWLVAKKYFMDNFKMKTDEIVPDDTRSIKISKDTTALALTFKGNVLPPKKLKEVAKEISDIIKVPVIVLLGDVELTNIEKV